MLIKPLLILVFMNPMGELKIAHQEIDRCPSPKAVQVIAQKVLDNQDYFVKIGAKCISPKPLA